jgi:hypothetical protein
MVAWLKSMGGSKEMWEGGWMLITTEANPDGENSQQPTARMDTLNRDGGWNDEGGGDNLWIPDRPGACVDPKAWRRQRKTPREREERREEGRGARGPKHTAKRETTEEREIERWREGEREREREREIYIYIYRKMESERERERERGQKKEMQREREMREREAERTGRHPGKKWRKGPGRLERDFGRKRQRHPHTTPLSV